MTTSPGSRRSPTRLLAVGGPLHGKRWHAHDGAATSLERGDDGEYIEHRYEVWDPSSLHVERVLMHSEVPEDYRLALAAGAISVERDRLAKAAHALYARVKALAGAQSAVGGELSALGLDVYAAPDEVPVR